MHPTIVVIDGNSLRHNIHAVDISQLKPILHVITGETVSTGFTALIHGPSQVIYDPYSKYVVYISTHAPVELRRLSLNEPTRFYWCISTHLPLHRSNKKFLRENPHITTLKQAKEGIKPVIALRQGKTGKASHGYILHIHSESEIYYATSQLNNIKPLSCGARSWVHTATRPYFDTQEYKAPIQPHLF